MTLFDSDSDEDDEFDALRDRIETLEEEVGIESGDDQIPLEGDVFLALEDGYHDTRYVLKDGVEEIRTRDVSLNPIEVKFEAGKSLSVGDPTQIDQRTRWNSCEIRTLSREGVLDEVN